MPTDSLHDYALREPRLPKPVDHSLADADIAMETLAFVGLADRADALAGTLNVAQKKRLELARSLAARPHLLLLDEVLAGLNPTEITKRGRRSRRSHQVHSVGARRHR